MFKVFYIELNAIQCRKNPENFGANIKKDNINFIPFFTENLNHENKRKSLN